MSRMEQKLIVNMQEKLIIHRVMIAEVTINASIPTVHRPSYIAQIIFNSIQFYKNVILKKMLLISDQNVHPQSTMKLRKLQANR